MSILLAGWVIEIRRMDSIVGGLKPSALPIEPGCIVRVWVTGLHPMRAKDLPLERCIYANASFVMPKLGDYVEFRNGRVYFANATLWMPSISSTFEPPKDEANAPPPAKSPAASSRS